MTLLLFIAGYAAVSAILYALMRIKCRRDPVFRAPRSRTLFSALSLTWGLPLTLGGAVVALAIRLCGRRPVRYGWGWGFYLPGIDWGLSLGLFFIAPESGAGMSAHELGHGIQNIYLGAFMPAVVLIPSFSRFWFRNLRERASKPLKTEYDSVWFEDSATKSGRELIKRLTDGGITADPKAI